MNMNIKMNSLTAAAKQRGATLLISLVLLLMLTILALTAARNASLQQRMAGNLQQQNLAFQFAENGIQAAILKLQDQDNRPLPNEPKYLYSSNGTGLPSWQAADCGTKTDPHHYCAKVEETECSYAGEGSGLTSIGVNISINLGGGSCYRIISSGRFESSTAIHQQGYVF